MRTSSMPADLDSSDDAAIIRASLAEPELFGVIFDRHVRSVFASVAARAGTDRAEGLTVDVFAIAFDARHRYEPRHTTAAPWLIGIATNVIHRDRRDARRSRNLLARARQRRDVAPDELEDVPARADATAGAATLRAALAALPTDQRDVLVLYAVDGLSYAEVARIVDAPIGTVRSRLSRARAALRRTLTDLNEGIVS